MAIQRIAAALHLELGGHFFILYGPGIEDTLINESHQDLTIERALWEHLRFLGFERIVFYAPHRQIYFFDAQSYELSRPSGLIAPRRVREAGKMARLSGGPLEEKVVFMIEDEPPVNSGPVGSGMGDVHALRLLDTLMRAENGPRTAVVVLQAEAALHYIEDPRTMAGLLGEWTRLPLSNNNVCLFVFSADTYADLCEVAGSLSIPEIRSLILRWRREKSQISPLALIGGPDPEEVRRLIELVSIRSPVWVNESELDRLIQWMATEGLRARQWFARIRQARREAHSGGQNLTLSLETARSQNWFAADLSNRPVSDRLEEMVGLGEVKMRLREMAAWYNLNHDRQAAPPMLHMIFAGNPGTGKTTIARLVGEMYREAGILKRGHLVEARAVDLVADHVGGTAIRTNTLIDHALDGVLFIDEAYALVEKNRGSFGEEAVETLLTRMEDDRDRLVVIAAGYTEKMRQFLEVNPGLARRFPEDNRLTFPDFSPSELRQIFDRLLSTHNLDLDPNLSQTIDEVINQMHSSRSEGFGNAGEIRNLVEAVDRRRALRVVDNHLPVDEPLRWIDFPELVRAYQPEAVADLETILGELDRLVGLKPVKRYLRRQARLLQLEAARRSQTGSTGKPLKKSHQQASKHLIFQGNPGTGKTTVARLMGQMLKALGVLRKGHCVEVSRVDLVAGFVGQTAIKTMERIKEALDGVLFIDEAYALIRGGSDDFGHEAIETLVKAMEDYSDHLVVIAAGYTAEMQNFIASNPGLESRFSACLDFPDFTSAELMEIFHGLCSQRQESLSPEADRRLADYFIQVDPRKFGNGRGVLRLYEEMKGRLADRIFEIPGDGLATAALNRFEVTDVPS
ncbi:MAG TPA: AAA family ATPase [Anaerolineaceae bacterium]|nr:AAA family ATPase [Anaerolineaceae bacterium]